MRLTLVTPAQPCSACAMLNQLALSVCERLLRAYPFVELERRVLEKPGDAWKVEGLEVDRLPALLIDGEQATAGTIPDRKAIARYIESKGA